MRDGFGRSVKAVAHRVRSYDKPGFWDNDVLTNIEGVLEVILEALASPAPHPNPLPGGEREHAMENEA